MWVHIAQPSKRLAAAEQKSSQQPPACCMLAWLTIPIMTPSPAFDQPPSFDQAPLGVLTPKNAGVLIVFT
jgi:hypothetical protein